MKVSRLLLLAGITLTVLGIAAYLVSRSVLPYGEAGGVRAEGEAPVAATPPGTVAPAQLPPDTDERHYLTPAAAQQGAALRILPPGARSVLKVDGQLSYGQWIWQDADVPEGDIIVRADLRNQLLSVFRGGHEIGTAVMLYGAEGHETPVGSFPIRRKVADYHSRAYDAPMPYSLFLTDDGVAIHGSDVRYGRATHGCVGLPEEFAQRLFAVADTGDRVEIYRGPASLDELVQDTN